MKSDSAPLCDTGHRRSGAPTTPSLRAADMYRQMIELASDIVYRTDVRGRFTFYNHAAGTVLRYDSQELIGRHYLRLVHPDHRVEVKAHWTKPLRGIR